MAQNKQRKEPTFGESLTQMGNVDIKTLAPTLENASVSEQDVKVDEVEDIENTVKEFQFTPTEDVDNVQIESENTDNSPHLETDEKGEEVKPAGEGFTTERIIPSAVSSVAGTIAAAATEKTNAVKEKMPAKTRRLLLVGVLALVLVVIFFLLKPNTPETVEELQTQQGSSLPIEFRPVDEAEAKRAEEQARAEQEAAAKAQAQQAQMTEPTQQNQTMPQQLAEKAKAIQAQPTEQVKVQPKVERLTPSPQKEVVKVAAKPVVKPVAEKTVATKPIAEKPVVKVDMPSSTGTTVTKTMTVPKGVSLMQMFRDNDLNISDVNAMSKANSVVSNLKVGERVTVRLDKNNHVVEMSIGSGGKFTRQANGSYTFK